jgi:hypothetical protein
MAAASPSATTATTGACRNNNELVATADPAPGGVSSTVVFALGGTSSAACSAGLVVAGRVDAAGPDVVQATTVRPTNTATNDDRIRARAVIMALQGGNRQSHDAYPEAIITHRAASSDCCQRVAARYGDWTHAGRVCASET